MNEKIKKLANEVFAVTDDGRIDYANEYMIERFVGLIVQECVGICTEGNIEKPMGLYYSNQIKKHFGIE